MKTETNDTSKVVAPWPGAFGIYKLSKQAVKTNLWPIIDLYLISFLITIVLEIIFPGSDPLKASANEGFKNIFSFLLNIPIIGATTYLWLAGTKGQRIEFGDALKKGISLFLPMLLCVLLLYVLVGLSLILLVVPFFFVLPRLLLSTFYLVDKDLDAGAAIQASWKATKGHSLKAWGIIGVVILMTLPIISIIGIALSIYWWLMYSAALAVLYRHINGEPLSAEVEPETGE